MGERLERRQMLAAEIPLVGSTGYDGVELVEPPAETAPVIEQVVINDGNSQRSTLTSIDLHFSGPVLVAGQGTSEQDPTGQGTSAPGGSPTIAQLTRVEDGSVIPLLYEISNGSGSTQIRLTFDASLPVDGGQRAAVLDRGNQPSTLANGNYQLVVFADSLSGVTGLPLDGNGDGLAGDHFVYSGDDLFRWYGDAAGDGRVGLDDFGIIRRLYSSSRTPDSPENAASSFADDRLMNSFDANGDQVLSLLELAQFRQNFGKSRATMSASNAVAITGLDGTATSALAVEDHQWISMIDGIPVVPGQTVATPAGNVTIHQDHRHPFTVDSAAADQAASFTYTLTDGASVATGTIRVESRRDPDPVSVVAGQSVTLDPHEIYPDDMGGDISVVGFANPGDWYPPTIQIENGIQVATTEFGIVVSAAPGTPEGEHQVRYLVSHALGDPGSDGYRNAQWHELLTVQVSEPSADFELVDDRFVMSAGTIVDFDPLANDLAVDATNRSGLRLTGLSSAPDGSFTRSMIHGGARMSLVDGRITIAAPANASGPVTFYYQADASGRERKVARIDLNMERLSIDDPIGSFILGEASAVFDPRIVGLLGTTDSSPRAAVDRNVLQSSWANYRIIDGELQVSPHGNDDFTDSLVVMYQRPDGIVGPEVIQIQHIAGGIPKRFVDLSLESPEQRIAVVPESLRAHGTWSVVGVMIDPGHPSRVPIEFSVSGNRSYAHQHERGGFTAAVDSGELVLTMSDRPLLPETEFVLTLESESGALLHQRILIDWVASPLNSPAIASTLSAARTPAPTSSAITPRPRKPWIERVIKTEDHVTYIDVPDLVLADGTVTRLIPYSTTWFIAGWHYRKARADGRGIFGTLDVVDGRLRYTRNSPASSSGGALFGPDDFIYDYTLDDGTSASSIITVTNSRPLLGDDAIVLQTGETKTIDLLANDRVSSSYSVTGVSTTLETSAASYRSTLEIQDGQFEIVDGRLKVTSVSDQTVEQTLYYVIETPDGDHVFGGRVDVSIESPAEQSMLNDDAITMYPGDLEATVAPLENDVLAGVAAPVEILGIRFPTKHSLVDGEWAQKAVGRYGELIVDGNELRYRRTHATGAGVEHFEYAIRDTVGRVLTSSVEVILESPLLVEDVIEVPSFPHSGTVDLLANDTLPPGFEFTDITVHGSIAGQYRDQSASDDDWAVQWVDGKLKYSVGAASRVNRTLYYSVANADGQTFVGGNVLFKVSGPDKDPTIDQRPKPCELNPSPLFGCTVPPGELGGNSSENQRPNLNDDTAVLRSNRDQITINVYANDDSGDARSMLGDVFFWDQRTFEDVGIGALGIIRKDGDHLVYQRTDFYGSGVDRFYVNFWNDRGYWEDQELRVIVEPADQPPLDLLLERNPIGLIDVVSPDERAAGFTIAMVARPEDPYVSELDRDRPLHRRNDGFAADAVGGHLVVTAESALASQADFVVTLKDQNWRSIQRTVRVQTHDLGQASGSGMDPWGAPLRGLSPDLIHRFRFASNQSKTILDLGHEASLSPEGTGWTMVALSPWISRDGIPPTLWSPVDGGDSPWVTGVRGSARMRDGNLEVQRHASSTVGLDAFLYLMRHSNGDLRIGRVDIEYVPQFGFHPTDIPGLSVSGRLFLDVNENGVDDDSQVTSEILAATELRVVAFDGTVIESERVDRDGRYQLTWSTERTPARLHVVPPEGFAVTLANSGESNALDNDIEPLSGYSFPILAGMRDLDIGLAVDADHDRLADVVERHYGLDPLVADDAITDSDSDGVSDLVEQQLWGTNRHSADSDEDGIDDLIEHWIGSHPWGNAAPPPASAHWIWDHDDLPDWALDRLFGLPQDHLRHSQHHRLQDLAIGADWPDATFDQSIDANDAVGFAASVDSVLSNHR